MTKSRDLANAATALSAVSATELGYVDGVTSAIQTQMDAKAPSSTAVTLTGTQTLTNKTLTNPVIASVINNTLTTAKGDLVTATAASTPAALAVGNNGESLVADSAATTGLRWQTPVQQNPVLNSAFQVWQRGTSVAQLGGIYYNADRWCSSRGGFDVGSTISRQATGDTTNLPNIQYCARVQRNNATTSVYAIYFSQTMETLNSIQFAGKTITVSFYARKGANYSSASSALALDVNSGTGTDQNILSTYTGSASVISQTATLTTTWQRFTYTGSVASTATELGWYFSYTPVGTAGAADYFEVTGFQVEVGSVATPFHTYAATIQGELAACQRYYYRQGGDEAYQVMGTGITEGANIICNVPFPVTMRVKPTSIDYSTLMTYDGVTIISTSSAAIGLLSRNVGRVTIVPASAPTNYRPYWLFSNNSTSAYLGFSAEL